MNWGYKNPAACQTTKDIIGRLFVKRNIARHAAINQALAGQSVIADSIRHRQHQQYAND